MKVCSYYLKTESGDFFHIISLNEYSDAIDFMKHEVEDEYDEWKRDGYSDDEIPYCDYDRQELEV